MTAPALPPIDVDDPATWPPHVVAEVQPLAKAVRGKSRYLADLLVPIEGEDDFRALLSGYLLRTYHATRLLDHEVAMIRERGLRPLTEQLVKDRINAALANSCITQKECQQLLAAHLFAPDQARNMRARVGKVCLILSQHAFRHEPDLAAPLLEEWGGEAITMTKGGSQLRPMLAELGKPALVVANIDLSQSWRTHFVNPNLKKVFVANLIQPGGLGADVFYEAPVPPEQVVATWQPGDPEYDQFKGLPRT